MSESPKTQRQVLLGTIHHAAVTRSDAEGPDSLRLSSALAEAAGFLPNEKIELYDGTSGARLSLRLVLGEDVGALEVSGPAAQLVQAGDQVTLSVFGWMREKSAARHEPRVVRVDALNRVVEPPPAPEKAPFVVHRSPRKK